MPKCRKPNIIHRIKKFRIKNDPFIKSFIISKRLDEMANLLFAWLYSLDISEKLTIPILEANNVSENLKAYYIALGKQIVSKQTLYDLQTLEIEIKIIVDKWVKRGLDPSIIEQIKDPNFFVGFLVTHILDKEKLMQKYGWFDYSRFDISHFW